jgi:hypothetical protein
MSAWTLWQYCATPIAVTQQGAPAPVNVAIALKRKK